MLNASQRLMKRAALSAESFSRMPPRCFGWLATMPTGRPPMRARQVMIVRAQLRLEVEVLAVVDDPPDHVVHVVRACAATRAGCRAAPRPCGRPGRRSRRIGGASSQLRREEREVVLDRLDALLVGVHLEVADARLAAVDLASRRAPPGSTSSPVTALTRCGPASAIEPRPLTIGTKSARPGDVGGARPRTGPSARRPAGRRRSSITSSRNRWPEPANSEPDRLLDARAGGVEQPDAAGCASCSAISRRRATFISPVMPIEPAMTVKS